MPRRFVVATHTALVFEKLKEWPSEFARISDLANVTHSTRNQVSAALHHLRNRRAVDVVIEADGSGWWFATPHTDNRIRHVDERELETKPRKPRKCAGNRGKAPPG